MGIKQTLSRFKLAQRSSSPHGVAQNIFVVTLLLVFSGCVVAPKAMVDTLGPTLSPACLSLWRKDGPLSYQHAAIRAIGSKASFAVAGDPEHQACAWAASGPYFDITSESLLALGGHGIQWAKVDAIALSKCETVNRTKQPCRILLHNNSLVEQKPSDPEDRGGFK